MQRTLIGYTPMQGRTLTHVAPVYLNNESFGVSKRTALVLRPLCYQMRARVVWQKDAIDEEWKRDLVDWNTAADAVRALSTRHGNCPRCWNHIDCLAHDEASALKREYGVFGETPPSEYGDVR